MRGQKAQSHARRVRGHASPDFLKKIGAILVHSRAHFRLHYFAVFEVIFFLNVAFADKSENKEKE